METFKNVPRSKSNQSPSLCISSNNLIQSTPDSSQTDSDDLSPQIQRKRKTTNIRNILPKLSVEENDISSTLSGGSSSTASSRDTSPSREITPIINSLKPPIEIKRSAKGFGFTVHTIRVYFGDSDFYTTHHLVMAVDEASPAFEAGLRAADLITHVNNEPIQGLYHTQVLQLLFKGTSNNSGYISLRATPLDQTSIKTGGRKRNYAKIKFAKKSSVLGVLSKQNRKQKKDCYDKKRKTSLFRKISTKRASESYCPPSENSPTFTGSSYLDSLYLLEGQNSSAPTTSKSNTTCASGKSTLNTNIASFEKVESINQIYQRPSTLHGLKHKIHTPTGHRNSMTKSGNRRKSLGHIPLSPLARTPSPSPLPISPTRSPSPLTHCMPHHLAGSSNTTQSYSPMVNNIEDTILNMSSSKLLHKSKDDLKIFPKNVLNMLSNSSNMSELFNLSINVNSNTNLSRIQEESLKSSIMLTISEETEIMSDNLSKTTK